MASIRRFPYLLGTDDSVCVTGWHWKNSSGHWTIMPSGLSDWDPATPVSIQAVVEIDPEGLRQDCGFGEDTVVQASIVWHCPGTGLRGRGSAEDLVSAGQRVDVTLQADIGGSLLSDRLNVIVYIVLLRPGKEQGPLSARRAGSILWGQERQLLLEGHATRFPMELKDFSAAGWLPPHAAWYLDWTPTDLNQLVLADLRLFANSSHDAIREAATGTGEPAGNRMLQEAIRYDVARTLIEGSLENEHFVTSPDDFSEGTVGAAARRLVSTLFPGQQISAVAEYYRRDRFRFELQLQDRLRLFKEV